MSDTTPNDGKTNPKTDASATTPEHREHDNTETGSSAVEESSSAADTEPDRNSGTGSHSAFTPEPVPEPVAADPDKRETYVPSSTYGSNGATIRSDDSVAREQYPEYNPEQPVSQTPIYVQAPTPPRNRSNRGFGILVALLAAVVYAALYSLVAFLIAGVTSNTIADAGTLFREFAVRPVFYVPVIFFFLAFALLIAIVNRGGWAAYVIFSFLVAIIVYFSFIGGALLTVQAWTLTPADAANVVSAQWLNPGGIAAAIIAREVTIWAGAWIARRGRNVTARNSEASEEYERVLAEGPQLDRRA